MKKKPKVVKDTSGRWLLTYSDLMNLLLILFIILYSISNVNAEKMKTMATAMQHSFNGTASSSGTGQGNAGGAASSTASSSSSDSSSTSSSPGGYDYTQLYADIMALISQRGLQDKVVVQMTPKSVIISLNDTVLFDRGSAELGQNSLDLIATIGNMLKNVNFSQLVVEGFTDSDPIHTDLYKDNRDLSSERANNVARILQSRCGIAGEKISSLGYGEFRPVAPNDNDVNKAKNRRVVITILKQDTDADAAIAANKSQK